MWHLTNDRQIRHELRELEIRIMAAIDDLKTAVAGLGTSISAEITAATAAITAAQAANNGAVSAADAEAVVAQLNALKDTVDAETAALTAPPPPSA